MDKNNEAKLLTELLERLTEKERKIDELIRTLTSLSDMNRKINEIHMMHFPAEHLKKVSMKERFLYEILNTPVRKRKG